jgi:hypothetical protein
MPITARPNHLEMLSDQPKAEAKAEMGYEEFRQELVRRIQYIIGYLTVEDLTVEDCLALLAVFQPIAQRTKRNRQR